jgi:hypothetical protein
MGPRQVPSNIILPPQDIFVMFTTISLNKPTYRLPLLPNREVRLAGIQGQALVDDLLPAVQNGGGKISMDILNKLRFTRVGLTSVLQPNGDFQQDVDASVTLSPKHQVLVSQPPFTCDVLVAAMTDLSGDRQTLLPTDVKVAVSASNPTQINTVSLTAPAQPLGAARDVVTVALTDKGHKLSGIVTDSAGKVVRPGEFLPASDLPDAQELPDSVTVAAPLQGVGAVVFETGATSVQGKHTRAAWMVYTLPSAGTVAIPAKDLLAGSPIGKYSVVQLEFDKNFSEKALDGRTIMRKLQRFTRSSATIGASPQRLARRP